MNKELRLRLEWLSAIVQVTEIMARSSDYSQIYEKIIQIIKTLFAVEDTFIAELDEKKNQLKILAHTCRSDLHPDLIGSLTTLPEGILPIMFGKRAACPHLCESAWIFERDDRLAYTGFNDPGNCACSITPARKELGFLGLEMQEEGRTITIEESNLISIFSTDIAQINRKQPSLASQGAGCSRRTQPVARDLHDSVTQVLFAASVLAEVLPQIWRRDPEQGLRNWKNCGS